jgi:hypothetical protein
MDANENYMLAAPLIDLTTLGDWIGPKDYAGHFNGNGNTIKLQLSKGDSDTGLFDSIADGAVIENLNVEVSTKGDGIDITNDVFFGAVVGGIRGYGGTFNLKGISVSGELKYRSITTGKYLLAGGLMGQAYKTTGTKLIDLTIENCESDLTINADLNGSGSSVVAVGGLIGKFGDDAGTVTIRNSRTGGEINVTVYGTQYTARVGGIIGAASNDTGGNAAYTGDNGAARGNLIIENCYSTTEIVADKKNTSGALSAAGGIVGFLNIEGDKTLIDNNIALNPSLIAKGNNTNEDGILSGRVIGKTKVAGPLVKYLDNYALDTVKVGTKNGGQSEIVWRTGDEIENLDSSRDGATITEADLSSQSFWTEKGFDTKNWDFNNRIDGKYPRLKKAAK